MRLIQYIVITLTSLICLASCQKAGTGGANTLLIKAQHHGVLIPGATAMVKFDTKVQPGTDPSEYDLVQTSGLVDDHIHVSGLKRGKYYIYCTGVDTSISQTVSGGIPLTLDSKSGETEIIVPVTEGD